MTILNKQKKINEESPLNIERGLDPLIPTSSDVRENQIIPGKRKPSKKTSKMANAGKKKTVKYRKAPQAPKRGKSAFIIFSMDAHPKMRRTLDDGTTSKAPDVAKRVSEAWRNLSPDERAVWEEKADKDRMRYEVEKKMYSGPWKLPTSDKRAKKDPDAPKRPMSAFLDFSKRMRSQVKREHPEMSNTIVSKILANMWKDAPAAERASYIEREAEKRACYNKAISEWRTKRDDELASARESREKIAREVVEEYGDCFDTPCSATAILTENGREHPKNQENEFVQRSEDSSLSAARQCNMIYGAPSYYADTNHAFAGTNLPPINCVNVGLANQTLLSPAPISYQAGNGPLTNMERERLFLLLQDLEANSHIQSSLLNDGYNSSLRHRAVQPRECLESHFSFLSPNSFLTSNPFRYQTSDPHLTLAQTMYLRRRNIGGVTAW
eukprot:CAMPEP_0195508074 /NCGR_PEP_ID=MMETSP0794_2-20130614/1382_1 /TAXON_ID=515487 /ORGANISM="Stephanopyxis turris, Strain CCMP 815" /LENGTH=439 /DNA_ID=CAMNT_0040634947 /DNA_START=62 /DNA_END=1381 /DNA_ORIENTATION=+